MSWLVLILLVIFISVYTLSISNLYIFKLDFILSHRIGWELANIDPFLAKIPILYPLETPGNQKASSVFRGYKLGIMARNGVTRFIIARWGPAQKISFLLACCFMRPNMDAMSTKSVFDT